MYEVLYEISIFDVIGFCVLFSFLSFFAIIATIVVFLEHYSFISKIILTVISLVFFILTSISIIGLFFVDNIYAEYKNGNYETVSGIIEDYKRNEEAELKYEQFTVSNVYFEYELDASWGYSVNKSKGFEFKNGDNVKIYYIYDELANKNVIVKLEILRQ